MTFTAILTDPGLPNGRVGSSNGELMIGFSMTTWLTRSPAVQKEQMRKPFVLKCSPASCLFEGDFLLFQRNDSEF
jgi:hypothetical protein